MCFRIGLVAMFRTRKKIGWQAEAPAPPRRVNPAILAILSQLLTVGAFSAQGAEPPKTWIDPDTGHRVVRLTEEPGSASLYFNQNGYTADGRKMIYTTPEGISALDLETRTAKSRSEERRVGKECRS